ncbi:MAG TPA: hypothetical protein VGN95_09075 [Pyrinomonadaceae bacterium]|nr:hypothetical protein [Pyrinomonadaceae bacterium]
MATKNSESLVLLGKQNGWTLVSTKTPLTRLNYFDGKFLRAADLKAEQDYLRQLVKLSNEADGPGVAYGFDLTLGGGGNTLNVGPGLAIDPTGRVLLLTDSAPVDIQQLIEKSRNKDLDSTSAAKASADGKMFGDCETASTGPPTSVLQPRDLYLITVSYAEGYCGEEDVYGKLCEEACVTSTDRPFVVEGLMIRAEPLDLGTPLATSSAVALTMAHRRSLVASAYFNDERQFSNSVHRVVPSLISGAGLKSDIWCFGAQGMAGTSVPLGVLARAGSTTLFLDVWTARRERIDTPAKRYWQWRMRMRPWDVFLAQILQFQCQLRGLFQSTPVPGVPDPCDDAHKLVAEASEMMAEITRYYEEVSSRLAQLSGNLAGVAPFKGGVTSINALQRKLQTAKEAHLLMPSNRLLINGGIVELPSAGYLPVAPGEAISVNEQVRLMMGEGVDLRFCIVRPDYVANALEEAQHMERISLIEGLDDPKKIPEVDILVPDGEIIEEKKVAGKGFEATLDLLPGFIYALILELTHPPESFRSFDPKSIKVTVPFRGAARSEVLPGGGRAFHIALQLDEKQLMSESALAGFAMSAGRTINVAPTNTAPTNTATFSFNKDESEKKDANGAVADDVGASASEAGAAEAGSSEESAPEESTPNKRLFQRLKRAALRMSRNAATMRAESGQDAESDAPASGVAAGASFRGPTAVRAPEVGLATTQPLFEAGAWLTMRCDKDPSKLQAGEVLQVDANVVAGLTSPMLPNSVYFDGGVIAKILINDVRTSGGRKTIACTVNATATVTAKLESVKEPDSATVHINAEFSWGNVAGGAGKSAEIVVHDPEGGGGVRFKATWGKQPLEVEGLATFLYEQWDTQQNKDVLHEVDAATVKFLSNADVLEPENENHVWAVKALQVIGTALNRPSFVDISTAMLFPPLPPPSAELTVRARHDWVLFHRRRTKTCKLDVPPRSPVPNRRYQVYHLAIKDVGLLDMIQGALKNNNVGVLQELNFKPVTVVEFGANLATLASNQQNVVTDWNNASPGNILVYAAVASQSGVEGGSFLATQRLNRTEDAIASVSHADAQTKVETLSSIPTPLTAPGTDGSIILITRQESQQTCQTVYRILDVQIEEVTRLIRAGQLDDVISKLSPLGNVSFKPTTSGAEAVPETLKTVIDEWKNRGGGNSQRVIVATAGSVTPLPDNRIQNQAQIIHSALGGGSSPQGFTFIQTTLPPGCAAISFFGAQKATTPAPPPPPAVEATCVTVVRLLFTKDLEGIKRELQAGQDIVNFALDGKRGQVLGHVTFVKGSTTVLNDSLAPLRAVLDDRFTIAGVENTLVLARSDSTNNDRLAFQNQAAFLRQTFRGEQTGTPELVITQFPARAACPAIVFLVAQDIPG